MNSFRMAVILTFGLWMPGCNVPQPQAVEQDLSLSSEEYYQEQHRPQYHFSPDSMWMNDPNGMVFYNGEYHLFYQYYPDSTVWGPMHWGHAVSTDLLHWKHLPVALYPDSLGYIFSGSAVVDWNNTSGFGSQDKPPLVAIFTYHDVRGEKSGEVDFQTQAIAFSNDDGRTWTKYEGNPVIANPGIKDFRDPKVIWHEPTQKWVMVFAADDHVKIYNSSDLKEWQLISEFGKDQGSHGGVWECPDLFPLTTEAGEEKWVMIVSLGDGAPNGGSGTMYFIGDFDGIEFANDNPKEEILWLDYGRDNYAGVTWSDVPAEDGRRIFLGWMSNWKYAQVVPTEVWRSAMTLPRTLELKQTEAGLRVVSMPVREVNYLFGTNEEIAARSLEADQPLVLGSSFDQATSVLELTLAPGEESNFVIELSNVENQRFLIGYDTKTNQFYTDRTAAGKADFSDEFTGIHYAPRISRSKNINLKLFIDVSSVELFADHGEVVMTDLVFPESDYHQIRLISEHGNTEILGGSITEIKSVWN